MEAPIRHQSQDLANKTKREDSMMEQILHLTKMNDAAARRNAKMATNMVAAVSSIGKIMEGAKAMVRTLAQSSKDNLEAQRIRLRVLEVRKENPIINDPSEVRDNKRKTEDLEVGKSTIEVKKMKPSNEGNVETSSENKSVNSINLNKKINSTEKMVEQEVVGAKFNIKRNYQLKKDSNFNIWLDYLKSELMSNDLLEIIEPNNENTQNWSAASLAKMKNWVRDIIINRLEEKYHKKIINIREPLEILKILRSSRKSEVNVTHTSVRTRLYAIRMKKDETVNDFSDRFDAIVREYEACEEIIKSTEQKIRSAFYQAVSSAVPELRNADLIKKQTTGQEMNLEEIKSYILQLEAEKSQRKSRKSPRLKELLGHLQKKTNVIAVISLGIGCGNVRSLHKTNGTATFARPSKNIREMSALRLWATKTGMLTRTLEVKILEAKVLRETIIKKNITLM